MNKRIIQIMGLSIVMLLASSLAAEAHERFYFGFSFGFGVGHYRPYGHYAYHPAYYSYYPGPYIYRPYYYRSYYPAPVVSYYFAPHYRYYVYRTDVPVYRHEGRAYSNYVPRRYYRYR